MKLYSRIPQLLSGQFKIGLYNTDIRRRKKEKKKMTEIQKAIAAKVRAAKMLKEAQDEMEICDWRLQTAILSLVPETKLNEIQNDLKGM